MELKELIGTVLARKEWARHDLLTSFYLRCQPPRQYHEVVKHGGSKDALPKMRKEDDGDKGIQGWQIHAGLSGVWEKLEPIRTREEKGRCMSRQLLGENTPRKS